MAEGGEGTCPQVFVVDSQANYISVPSRRKRRWERVGHKFIFLLVGITMLGLVVEGCFIYNLYKKTKTFSFGESHHLCQNLSNPKASKQQGGTIMATVGPKESNEIPTVRPHAKLVHRRPFAQVIGSNTPIGPNDVVQWMDNIGESIIQDMKYNNGQLLVDKDGYYYLYSKVTLNVSEECSLVQHKMMKKTNAYGLPIELMKSKSIRCRHWKSSNAKISGGDDVWNSFLAGIFQLQRDDEIFVKLEGIQKMLPGATDNLMGAFMIFP